MTVKTKKNKVQEKSKSAVPPKLKGTAQAKSKQKTDSKQGLGVTKVRVVNKISPPRVASNNDEHKTVRVSRMVPQYAYMKAPGMMYDFQVGDTVEVFCDHEKNRERVRGWIRGIVVQVDNKMVAVQFRSNVFLTDGWMVPDRILWYPLNSEHIRPVVKKSGRREKAIPDY